MGAFRLLGPLLGPALIRLALTIAVGAGLATALGLVYPVHRELDTAAWSRALFASQAAVILPPASAEDLRRHVGPSCLAATWVTSMSEGPREVAPAHVIGIDPQCDESLTTFPAATRLAEVPVTGDRWIDLSADAAHALGVTPGATVTIATAPGRPPLALVVRGVYAVRPGGQYGGRTTAAALFSGSADPEQDAYSVIFSPLPPDTLTARLASPDAQRLLSPKAPPLVEARSLGLDAAARRSSATLGLVGLVGAFATAAAVALALREIDVFRRRLLDVLRLVYLLGGDAPRLLTRWEILSVAVGTAALTVGAGAGLLPYALGWAAPALPSAVLVPFAGCLLGAVLVVFGVQRLLHGRALSRLGGL